ncbi:MAG: hypothetical protein NXI20_22590 [bacterium]|nr:hypothetical protein [bacterium]
MKKDIIEDLLKESRLETSDDFSIETMRKLDEVLSRRMKVRLYLLMSFVSLVLVAFVVFLIYTGFEIKMFGEIIALPKVASMVIVSILSYLVLGHLSILKKPLFNNN